MSENVGNKNVFIVSAGRSFSILDNLRRDPSTVIAGVLVYEPWDYPEWSGVNTGLTTWGWEQIAEKRLVADGIPLDIYEVALAAILSDERVFYLFERHYGVNWNVSTFNRTSMLEVLVWNALVLLEASQPEIIFFAGIPHNPVSWIFGRVAEVWGATALMLSHSPFFHRKWLVCGLDAQLPVAVQPNYADGGSDVAWEAIRSNRRPYSQAIPSYSREALNRAWRWRREVKYLLLTRPSNIVTKFKQAWNKWRLYRRYCALSVPVNFRQPYYVFFLHYQPEATTLPCGLAFAQQWLAISRLRMALPAHVQLVVKDHPGMFLRGMLRPSVRDCYFYDAIAGLPNTVLVDINQDSFDLMDHAEAVVTITGTAGFQALCRGKHVIVFGLAPYRHFPTVHQVFSVGDIRDAIAAVAEQSPRCDDDLLDRYSAWVEGLSFGIPGAGEEEWIAKAKDYDETCLKQSLSQLISNQWSFDCPEFRW
ncbi:hypothetical protein LH462_10170 [Laribacter hongkongensis]|uniref:capsular polysaccharide export protein, LipB/KpsS family n=1 Tax=Laribacter hongkongensis TaxID=168471 RepID=UPI001EFD9ED9|nr:hypothetical protein [Laribacter hongkongensis]MCG9101355.1 hypothetical protein [Laribacter hongkongensis]MCG9104083.1 hypothetical protein [Laribacter hongkongensis]MCG9113441.1 hypothetical protein [Laribacter hongkongensis]MCG9118919.1 hypothetical protein [Laribacter hongkongensis]